MNTNPKDAVGTRKVAMSCVPSQPVMELALALMDGARRYGRHNYRVTGVRASVYYDAAIRHLTAWWEGQECASDSNLPHLAHAMACLCIARDSQLRGNWVDDRPPSMSDDWQSDLNKKASDLIDRWPDAKEPYVRVIPKRYQHPTTADGELADIVFQKLNPDVTSYTPPNGHGNDFQVGNTYYTATTCSPTYHSLGMKVESGCSKVDPKGYPGQVTEIHSGDYLKWIGEQPVMERETYHPREQRVAATTHGHLSPSPHSRSHSASVLTDNPSKPYWRHLQEGLQAL